MPWAFHEPNRSRSISRMGSAQAISSAPRFHHISTILGCMWVGWQRRPKEVLRSPRRKEPSLMLERTIVGSSSDLMDTDTCKDLRRRPAVIPPLAQAQGSTDRDFMGVAALLLVFASFAIRGVAGS